MKYIEELENGDCFSHKDRLYLLTSDYKKNGQRLSYDLKSGLPLWFNPQDMIDNTQIYTLDQNNNIIPVKPTPKADDQI